MKLKTERVSLCYILHHDAQMIVAAGHRHDGHPNIFVRRAIYCWLGVMFNKYWLLLGMIPLAGCVTETRREAVTYSMPPVASAASEPADAKDPLGLASAIALVRQQPWCYRGSAMK